MQLWEGASFDRGLDRLSRKRKLQQKVNNIEFKNYVETELDSIIADKKKRETTDGNESNGSGCAYIILMFLIIFFCWILLLAISDKYVGIEDKIRHEQIDNQR